MVSGVLKTAPLESQACTTTVLPGRHGIAVLMLAAAVAYTLALST